MYIPLILFQCTTGGTEYHGQTGRDMYDVHELDKVIPSIYN